MQFLRKPTQSSKTIKAPIDIVWECVIDTDNWLNANKQILDIRRGSSGNLKLNETLEIDTQFESGDPISTKKITISRMNPKSHLVFEDGHNKQVYDFIDNGKKVVIKITSTSQPSFAKLMLRIFGMNEAKIIRDTFLTGIGSIAQHKYKMANKSQ